MSKITEIATSMTVESSLIDAMKILGWTTASASGNQQLVFRSSKSSYDIKATLASGIYKLKYDSYDQSVVNAIPGEYAQQEVEKTLHKSKISFISKRIAPGHYKTTY